MLVIKIRNSNRISLQKVMIALDAVSELCQIGRRFIKNDRWSKERDRIKSVSRIHISEKDTICSTCRTKLKTGRFRGANEGEKRVT